MRVEVMLDMSELACSDIPQDFRPTSATRWNGASYLPREWFPDPAVEIAPVPCLTRDTDESELPAYVPPVCVLCGKSQRDVVMRLKPSEVLETPNIRKYEWDRPNQTPSWYGIVSSYVLRRLPCERAGNGQHRWIDQKPEARADYEGLGVS